MGRGHAQQEHTHSHLDLVPGTWRTEFPAQTAWSHLQGLNWPVTQPAEVRVWLRLDKKVIILKSVCGLKICVPYPTAHSQEFIPVLLPAFPH